MKRSPPTINLLPIDVQHDFMPPEKGAGLYDPEGPARLTRIISELEAAGKLAPIHISGLSHEPHRVEMTMRQASSLGIKEVVIERDCTRPDPRQERLAELLEEGQETLRGWQGPEGWGKGGTDMKALTDPQFWEDSSGNPPAPFTMITAQDVREGTYKPSDPSKLPETLRILDETKEEIWPIKEGVDPST